MSFKGSGELLTTVPDPGVVSEGKVSLFGLQWESDPFCEDTSQVLFPSQILWGWIQEPFSVWGCVEAECSVNTVLSSLGT